MSQTCFIFSSLSVALYGTIAEISAWSEKMFGYVGPEKGELKVKELSLYQAYYCGLCKSIKARYGQRARAVLSYDCTFLAILLSGFHCCGGCTEERCAIKPLKGKQPIANSSEYLDFAADLNVLLSYYQFSDDWQDEKKIRGAAGKLLLGYAAKKAALIRPEMDRAVSNGIYALQKLEKQNDKVCVLDATADAFGTILRDCVQNAPVDPEQGKALRVLLYHLGRWIYLIDAWDDRDKDKKTGSFNPFLSADADEERASFALNASLNEAIKAYELLDIVSFKGILDNIFYEGCVNRTKSLLRAGGKHEQ